MTVPLAAALLAFVVVAPPLEVCLQPVGDPWCLSSRGELEAEIRAYRVSGPVETSWEVDGRTVQNGELVVRPGRRYTLRLAMDLHRPPREVTVRVRHSEITATDSWIPPPAHRRCPFDLRAESISLDGARGLTGTVTNLGPFVSPLARVRWFANGSLVSDSVLDPLLPGSAATLLLTWDEVPRSRRSFLAHAQRIGLPLPTQGDRYLGVVLKLELEAPGDDLDPENDVLEVVVQRRWMLDH